MSGERNWRTPTGASEAEDYFRHQQKAQDVADRRPVIRKTSDLVGPGIGAQATPITDFNNLLATYNGYYSAVQGSFGAPNADEAFIGFVVMDAALGGIQTFTGMGQVGDAPGHTYRRRFHRNPSDPSSIFWEPWEDTSVQPIGLIVTGLLVPYGGSVSVAPPDGYLLCNGGSHAATSQPDLFDVIGYSFGGSAGNFNVPDLRDRTLYGVGTAWSLGGSDGIAAGSRTMNLYHAHNIFADYAGDHGHTASTSVSVTVQNNVNTRTVEAGTNSSPVANGGHDHPATASASTSIGTSGNHYHGGTTFDTTDEGPNLRGVGVNWLIKN